MSEPEDQMLTDDEDDFDCAYYDGDDIDIREDFDDEKCNSDAEQAKIESLDTFQVERLLNESVASLIEVSRITPSLAKILLLSYNWDVKKIHEMLNKDTEGTLLKSGVKPMSTAKRPANNTCLVCYHEDEELRALCCGHGFCVHCWKAYFETRLSEGVSSKISCMASNCMLVAPPEFVLRALDKASLRAKYERFLYRDYVMSHPELRFCVGKDCLMVVRSKETKPKKATCTKCKTSFCVICGVDYHAPTSCDTIKKWLIKCADDSETANYISAHTKDCPQCHACIEKNGGCNHMQCAKCKHHFCWMCFGDWKSHGSEYYVCSRYKENPSVAAEANHVKARRALEKYLHYFERYENHNKSLKMEEELREKIKRKIDAKVNEHEGTWIDWQYLHTAATLLARCRYTLQYTYPFAYYLEKGPRKDLFEYQQGLLEKEVEELAWAVERAGTSDRGALEAHMHRAEHKRITLLQDFFFSPSEYDAPSSSKFR
ncbi:unnamed protein product, partial [Mesorhabditis belari]|uniref:RBR-type E3 ubiquitin transferase n=1 Tax=Mesorhabditis belari TaxID=2138241 RepID=A0AAF3FI92_9BILA